MNDNNNNEVGYTFRPTMFSRASAPAPAQTRGRRISPSSQRLQPLGFGSATVPAGSSATLTAVVQKPIQIQRLLLATAAPSGEVTVADIKVGTASQTAGVEPMPVEAFSPLALDVSMSFAPAGSGITVTIELQNAGADPAVVSGMGLGITAD